MSEPDLSTLRLENDRLRTELARLERELADERGALRTAQARQLALQSSLDEAHRHLSMRQPLPARLASKARQLVNGALRAVGLRRH